MEIVLGLLKGLSKWVLANRCDLNEEAVGRQVKQ
jgi:hypothetical protein